MIVKVLADGGGVLDYKERDGGPTSKIPFHVLCSLSLFIHIAKRQNESKTVPFIIQTLLSVTFFCFCPFLPTYNRKKFINIHNIK